MHCINNARVTILNAFFNMEFKMIKQIRQNKTWIKADIPFIHLTSVCIMHSPQPATVYVSNDVPIVTQRTLLRARVNRIEIVLKSTDRSSKITLFLPVQGLNHGCLTVFMSRAIRRNCFNKIWRILLSRILRKPKITIVSCGDGPFKFSIRHVLHINTVLRSW